MSSKVTVTGVIGPAGALTAAVYDNVTSFSVDCINATLSINQSGTIAAVDITGKSTLSLTQSSGSYTLSIS